MAGLQERGPFAFAALLSDRQDGVHVWERLKGLSFNGVESLLHGHSQALVHCRQLLPVDVLEPQQQASELVRDVGDVGSVCGTGSDEIGLREVGPQQSVSFGEQPPQLVDADSEVVQLLVHSVDPQRLGHRSSVHLSRQLSASLPLHLNRQQTLAQTESQRH